MIIEIKNDENKKEIAEQLHFDALGLGFNHGFLIVEFLRETIMLEDRRLQVI